MKDRLILIILILILWIFLVALEVYLPFFPSTLLVLGFIVAYCIILALAQLYQKRKSAKVLDKETRNDYLPSVNIYIPAHNEELVLAETIENLTKIDYPHYDILIIDDRSKDKTLDVAKELSRKYSDKVRYHSRSQEDFPGKSAVLNDALAMTDAEVICVFDADAKVDPDFLTRIIPYLAEHDVAAVQARKVMSNKDKNLLTSCQHFEYCMDSNVQLGRDSLRAAVELRGNGQLIKRKALEAVEGWNVHTLTDDLDISTKLHLKNFDIRFCPDVVVYEEAVESFNSVIKQRKRWAEGSIRRYLDYFKDILTSKDISFRLSLDMIAYFSEFVLPIWLVSDFVIQVCDIMIGGKPEIVTNLIVVAAIGLFFLCMLFSSILKFEKCGVLNSLKWSFATSIFVIILWTIVVASVVIKIVFTKRAMNWYKAERVGVS